MKAIAATLMICAGLHCGCIALDADAQAPTPGLDAVIQAATTQLAAACQALREAQDRESDARDQLARARQIEQDASDGRERIKKAQDPLAREKADLDAQVHKHNANRPSHHSDAFDAEADALSAALSAFSRRQKDTQREFDAAQRQLDSAVQARAAADNQVMRAASSRSQAEVSADLLERRLQELKNLGPEANPLAQLWLRRAVLRATPLTPLIVNDAAHRSAYKYAEVLEQFDVEDNYQRAPDRTFCNIFLWHATSAMGAEIPHWVPIEDSTRLAADRNSESAGAKRKSREMTVNDPVDWLKTHAQDSGWHRVDERKAQEMADGGHPAIAIWKNQDASKPGHAVVIRPGTVQRETGAAPGAAISQAGTAPTDAGHMEGFAHRKDVQYWCHD